MEELFLPGEHERVFRCSDDAAGYLSFIAIHNTVAGPAVGGTRLWHYASESAALEDVLRLSSGMTRKTAVAGIPLGGGKSVIMAPPGASVDRGALFRAHGRFIERLGGEYITAEDVGTSPADMAIVRTETAHVAGLPDGMGDPGPFTARGVYYALKAAARHRWNTDDLHGRVVVIQGCGNVGLALAILLDAAGARLIVSDIDPARVERTVLATGAEAVPSERVMEVDGDILAPCALGGTLNESSAPRIRTAIVVGAANNQLATPAIGDMLARRNVLYVPDYVANAGGVFSGCGEILGWRPAEIERRIEGIGETVRQLLERAEAGSITPAAAADALAVERLADKKGERRRDASRSGRS